MQGELLHWVLRHAGRTTALGTERCREPMYSATLSTQNTHGTNKKNVQFGGVWSVCGEGVADETLK